MVSGGRSRSDSAARSCRAVPVPCGQPRALAAAAGDAAQAPAAAKPECTFTVQNDVATPMRDGTVLRSNVYTPDGPGPYPILMVRHSLQQGPSFQRRVRRARCLGRQLLHRRLAGRARAVQVGRHLVSVPVGGDRRVRRDRMGGRAAEVEWQGRHVRLLVSGSHAVAAGDAPSAAPHRDHSGDDVVGLPRRMDVRRWRAVPGLHPVLADEQHREQRRAAPPGGQRLSMPSSRPRSKRTSTSGSGSCR